MTGALQVTDRTQDTTSLAESVRTTVLEQLRNYRQPSAWEIVEIVEKNCGWKGRLEIPAVLQKASEDQSLKRNIREYLRSLLESGDIEEALKGKNAPRIEIRSSIDALLQQTNIYRNSKEFQEMINFMARFRHYAPYNNLLVRIQNPTCSFYATARDWEKRFQRKVKEDARPMLILAPMQPVMLVYDLDETEGPELPSEVRQFGNFSGEFQWSFLERTVANAVVHDRIRVDFNELSSTNAGFVTKDFDESGWKMRIVIHNKLDDASKYGVLSHELAHIYLGHLGSDKDHWWPSRIELTTSSVEIEAEAVAFIVTSRKGLNGSCPAYVSRYLGAGPLPASVSLDLVSKVASRIEQMAVRSLPARSVGQK